MMYNGTQNANPEYFQTNAVYTDHVYTDPVHPDPIHTDPVGTCIITARENKERNIRQQQYDVCLCL